MDSKSLKTYSLGDLSRRLVWPGDIEDRLSYASKLFSAFSLMLKPDTSIEPQFFVTPQIVLNSEQR